MKLPKKAPHSLDMVGLAKKIVKRWGREKAEYFIIDLLVLAIGYESSVAEAASVLEFVSDQVVQIRGTIPRVTGVAERRTR